MKKTQWTLMSLFIAVMVSACGGGGGNAPPPGQSIPEVPANVKAAVGDKQLTLSWDNASRAETYNIYWNTTGSVTTADTKITGVTSAYEHTGLTNDTTYYYVVTAENELGESDVSSEIAATPQLPTIPTTPQNVRVTPDANQVTLIWNSVEGATSYNIYWDNLEGVTTADNKISTVSSPYTHSSLTNSARYNYIITAVNAAGESIPTGEMTSIPHNYNKYYVSAAAADDSGDGLSPATAKLTINAAITAASGNTPAMVQVNAGIYTVNSNPDTLSQVKMVEGVSLYGGYNADFTLRDPTVHVSKIVDVSTYSEGGLESSNRAIEAGTGISTATILDGFVVNGSDNTSHNAGAIWVSGGGAPTIQNNAMLGGIKCTESFACGNSIGLGSDYSSPIVQSSVLNGGTARRSYAMVNIGNPSATIRNSLLLGGNGRDSYAMDNLGAGPKVIGNKIYGGSGNYTYGIYHNSISTTLVQNNIIHTGAATTVASGIRQSGSALTLQNNTIFAGSGSFVFGVYLLGTDTIIDNNIIFASGNDQAYCIRGRDANIPASLRNNNLFGCASVYENLDGSCTGNADGDGNNDTCTLEEMETLLSGSGNISVDPLFADVDGPDNDISTMEDNDWHFSTSSPATVTAGGINGEDDGGWGFTTDKDGVARPGTGLNWSIGAYEPPTL